jgi:hypothetical protein
MNLRLLASGAPVICAATVAFGHLPDLPIPTKILQKIDRYDMLSKSSGI